MRLFVTGATGFVGSHFVLQALAAGHEVIALRRSISSRPRIFLPLEPKWIEKALGSVNPDDLDGSDALVHLAAAGVTPQPATWEMCYQVNVLESLQLVRSALAAGVKKVVASGSSVEYGKAGLRFDPIPPDAPLEPTDPYAASKASFSIAVCAMCRVEKFSLSYQRLFSVFGDGQHEGNFWPSLCRSALSGEDFAMTSGDQVRDFIPAEDVAKKLLAELADHTNIPGEPKIQNLASGKPVTLRQFAEFWWERLGARGKLLIGALPSRPNEVKRYVPHVQL